MTISIIKRIIVWVKTRLKENGFLWTIAALIREFFHRGYLRLDKFLRHLEDSRNLSGSNSVQLNYLRWQHHDWSQEGEEWSPSPQWKQALVDDIMKRYINSSKRILELGPGAGRWTESLLELGEELVLVDLSDHCIELCKKRFITANNISYFVNSGSDLPFIEDNSINAVWSFDVFVHINPEVTRQYLQEFARVLKPEGTAIIHHSGVAGKLGGWRSSWTGATFAKAIQEAGMTLKAQIDSWGNNDQYDLSFHGDIISIFEKPGA